MASGINIYSFFQISRILIMDIQKRIIIIIISDIQIKRLFRISEIVLPDIQNNYFGYPKYVSISDIQNTYLRYPE